MRRDLLFGVGLTAVLLLGILATFAAAEDSGGLLPFPTQSATITLSDSGLDISPSQLNPGPVVFAVVNNTSASRGVYVTGDDRVGDPLLRYSATVLPGGSGTMSFWLYQGQQYTFRDYTSRVVSDGRSSFSSSFTSTATIPTVIALGAGPQYPWMTGSISISDSDLTVTPERSNHGPIVFTVTNNTSVPRGVIIRGDDRVGAPIFRYSGLIAPGASQEVNFWLYGGKTYNIQEYTKSGMVRGHPRYSSHLSATLTVDLSSANE